MEAKPVVDKVIPSYPFVQYSDDEDAVAFFTSYNTLAQEYLDGFNILTLPYWPADIINGYLLDWIAEGIYGVRREKIQKIEGDVSKGSYNTIDYNTVPYAKLKNYIPGSTEFLPDEYFKRIMTWNFYKGDGFQFSIPWFKRRIARFLHGPAGIDPIIDNTFDVSIVSSNGVFSIAITDSGDGVATFLKTAIEQGMVNLPFIYSYKVTVS